MTSTTSTPPDLRPLLGDAIDIINSLMANTADDQLGRATPCGEYDVLALLSHLRGALERTATIAQGERAVGTMPDVAADPATIRVDVAEASRAAIDAWSDDALLTSIVHPPFGPAPGAVVVLAYSSEMLVHAWDLAVATGQTVTWPADEQLAIVLAGMRQALSAERDQEFPFAPPVSIDESAAMIDQLAAWSGRRPY